MSNSESTENNDESNSFAARLSELMARRGLTQKQLGMDIDVAQASVYKWLHGTLPRSGELHRLAKYFNVTMEWFLEGIPQKKASQTELDTMPLLSLQADRLASFLREAGWTMEQFEQALDVVNKVQSAADVTRLFQFRIKSGVDKLPEVENNKNVRLTWNQLKARLKKATESRGKRAELAKAIDVYQSRLNSWLDEDREPGAEATFRLLEWVTAEEAKTKSPGVAVTTPEQKAQTESQPRYEKPSVEPGKQSPGRITKATSRKRKAR